jgi:hypothetical protein
MEATAPPTGPDPRRWVRAGLVVRRLADGAPKLSDAAKGDLEAMMRRFLPDAPLTWMIGLGADAVAAELAAEPDRSPSGREP